MMCDALPYTEYRLGRWQPCSPMQELWLVHQEQARRFRLQLQGDGNQGFLPSRLYRDNGSTVRVAQGETSPTTMPLSIKNRILECPNGEN
jgi:hypothetical protein